MYYNMVFLLFPFEMTELVQSPAKVQKKKLLSTLLLSGVLSTVSLYLNF